VKWISILSLILATSATATPVTAACVADVYGRITCTSQQEQMYQEILPGNMRMAPGTSRPSSNPSVDYFNGAVSRPGTGNYSNGVRCQPNSFGGMDCR
jgi:hypothetical protein